MMLSVFKFNMFVDMSLLALAALALSQPHLSWSWHLGAGALVVGSRPRPRAKGPGLVKNHLLLGDRYHLFTLSLCGQVVHLSLVRRCLIL